MPTFLANLRPLHRVQLGSIIALCTVFTPRWPSVTDARTVFQVPAELFILQEFHFSSTCFIRSWLRTQRFFIFVQKYESIIHAHHQSPRPATEWNRAFDCLLQRATEGRAHKLQHTGCACLSPTVVHTSWKPRLACFSVPFSPLQGATEPSSRYPPVPLIQEGLLSCDLLLSHCYAEKSRPFHVRNSSMSFIGKKKIF